MYVLYKENIIPNVGGVHPQGIDVSLASYKGWNLANCPDEKAHLYKEFEFFAVSSDVARGLQLLNGNMEDVNYDLNVVKDPQIGNMGAPASAQLQISFSDSDKEYMEIAKTFINNLELKIITRAKVREIKDVEDDLVDLKRIVHSLITFVVDDWRVKPEEEKNKSKYKTVLDELDTTVADNIDILSTIYKDLKKLESIVDTEVEIAKVVDNYYLTKKL